MPLLRITCPSGHTERIVELLHVGAHATEVSVIPHASRLSGGDLILAEVPRGSIDALLDQLPAPSTIEGLHVAIEASRQLVSQTPLTDTDDEAVVWAQVTQDVHETGRLSWVNVLLMLVAAAIAAVGIIEDQLLLIVGAMALSPDYFPIADTCLAVVRRDGRAALVGLRTLGVDFGAAVVGAWLLTQLLVWLGIATANNVPTSHQLTQFISQPDSLSVVVALLAGVAGALAITLPDARGLVGVFVSITTIPAAANIGVAFAAHDRQQMTGAAIQLGVNVASLLVAGTATLEIRRHLRA